MKTLSILILLTGQLILSQKSFGQNIAINEIGNMPDTSAMLDVSSTKKGFLAPRMTTVQQSAIPLPANGLLIYNTTDNIFKVNKGTPAIPNWVSLTSGVTSTTNTLTSSTNTLSSTVDGVAATAPIINTVANTSAINTLTTTVNGRAAAGVPIINSAELVLTGTVLVSKVNGFASNGTDLATLTSPYSESTNTDNTNSNGGYTMNNVNIANKTFIRFSGVRYDQQFKITGITGGVSGKTIILYNTRNGNMIFCNLNNGSSSSNQILTSMGNEVNTNGAGAVTLIYDGTAMKWVIVSIQE